MIRARPVPHSPQWFLPLFRVTVVVVMVSSTPCGVAVVPVIVIRLQGHNKAPKKSNENGSRAQRVFLGKAVTVSTCETVP